MVQETATIEKCFLPCTIYGQKSVPIFKQFVDNVWIIEISKTQAAATCKRVKGKINVFSYTPDPLLKQQHRYKILNYNHF